MAAIVPYQQLTTLLAFCKRALRADPVLLEHFGRPDSIVSSTLEHDPFLDLDSGHPMLFRQEMPCLAIWWAGAKRIRASRVRHQGLHRSWGEDVNLRLVYVDKVYHGAPGVTARALASRRSVLVHWQLRRYLEDHKIDGVDEDFDLLTEGNIESLEMGDVGPVGDKDHDGFGADIQMVHYSAPYEEVSPMALQLIKLELHTNSDVVPSTTGPIISGNIVIPSS